MAPLKYLNFHYEAIVAKLKFWEMGEWDDWRVWDGGG